MDQADLNQIPNGAIVTAWTYQDNEHDTPPKTISGTLTKRWVSALEYIQCTVDGEIVNPSTIVVDDQ